MIKINSFKLKTLFLLVLLGQYSLLAETVILRTHEVIHGKITFQDANVLRMNDDLGKAIELQKNDILKVSYRDVKDAKEIKKIIDEEESKLPPEKRKKVASVDKRNKWSIVWRSAVLPGWGQWKVGKKGYAALSFVGMLGAIGYVSSKRSAALAAENSYQSKMIFVGFGTLSSIGGTGGIFPSGTAGIVTSAVLANSLFQPYGTAVTNYNNSLQIIGIVYGAQLIHSFFLGRAWEKEDPNTSIGKKAAYGDWNFNASPRQAFAPTANGVSRETYYEVNYEFRF